MVIIKITLGIAIILIAGIIGSKCYISLQKDIIKNTLEEYEEERRRREDAEQALLELDELEKELNDKSRE